MKKLTRVLALVLLVAAAATLLVSCNKYPALKKAFEKEGYTEVEMMETSEYGDTDLNSIIAGDRNFAFDDSESFGDMGFSKQEFDDENEELVSVDDEDDGEEDFDEEFDAILDEE